MELGEKFMIYADYYTNHPAAMRLLQAKQKEEEFFAVLLGCQMLLGHQLPLSDYLLKPVQRLLK